MRIALIAFMALALFGCEKPNAETGTIGRYQIAVDQSGNAWRVDTQTGAISKCWQGSPIPGAPPQCYRAVEAPVPKTMYFDAQGNPVKPQSLDEYLKSQGH